MITNSQLSTTQPKNINKSKKTKKTSRRGTDSLKWRSHGGLPAGRMEGGEWGKRYR